MRMWMVDPCKMCAQHLLGEHVEIHMLVGTLRRKKSVAGFIAGGLVELHNIRQRHAELVAEMRRRGMKHESPLPRFRSSKSGKIRRHANLIELAERCEKCRQLIARRPECH